MKEIANEKLNGSMYIRSKAFFAFPMLAIEIKLKGKLTGMYIYMKLAAMWLISYIYTYMYICNIDM